MKRRDLLRAAKRRIEDKRDPTPGYDHEFSKSKAPKFRVVRGGSKVRKSRKARRHEVS